MNFTVGLRPFRPALLIDRSLTACADMIRRQFVSNPAGGSGGNAINDPDGLVAEVLRSFRDHNPSDAEESLILGQEHADAINTQRQDAHPVDWAPDHPGASSSSSPNPSSNFLPLLLLPPDQLYQRLVEGISLRYAIPGISLPCLTSCLTPTMSHP